MRLRGICALLLADEEKGWFDLLDDLEMDPLGKTIQKIQALQGTSNMPLFSQDDYDALDKLRKTRNYWVHQCFIGATPVIVRNDGSVKSPEHAIRLAKDLEEAKDWEEKITNIEHSLLPKHIPFPS